MQGLARRARPGPTRHRLGTLHKAGSRAQAARGRQGSTWATSKDVRHPPNAQNPAAHPALAVLKRALIEEVAADASLYATDPRWKSLIAFVWDDSRRVEEHQKLVAGLKQLPMVIGAVVVSRPGKMDHTEPEYLAPKA